MKKSLISTLENKLRLSGNKTQELPESLSVKEAEIQRQNKISRVVEMLNSLNNQQKNPNTSSRIQKTVQETIEESFKELKITNQNNDRGQQSRVKERSKQQSQTKASFFIFKFKRQKAYVGMIKIESTRIIKWCLQVRIEKSSGLEKSTEL